MVRDDDPVDADLGGANRVRRVQDALDDERAGKEAAIAFEVAPGLRRGRGLTAAKGNDLLGPGEQSVVAICSRARRCSCSAPPAGFVKDRHPFARA
jgi:hypothetical protein